MNKCICTILILLGSVFTSEAQLTHLWSTHGHKALTYTPGIEASWFFNSYLGVQFGASAYLQSDDIHIINKTHDYRYNFYNANLDASTILYRWNRQHIGLTLGCIVYYGPKYEKVMHYEPGNYDVYTDLSHYYPEYGIDAGIYYTYRKFSILYKFDTAYKIHRFGVGYHFQH